MKKQFLYVAVLIMSILLIHSCSEDDKVQERNTEQEIINARNGKQGYIEHNQAEIVFIQSVKTKVDDLGHFDFGAEYENIKGEPDWDLAIIPGKHKMPLNTLIVPVIKVNTIKAFVYVFDGEILKYNFVDRSLIHPPYFVYVGPVNDVFEQVFNFYDNVLNDTTLDDGSGYDDGVFDEPEFGGCFTVSQVEMPCSCNPQHYNGESCNCEATGGNGPYVSNFATPVDCDEGPGDFVNDGGGSIGGSGGYNNNDNDIDNTDARVHAALKSAYSVCPIIPQEACQKLIFIINQASESNYCLSISSQAADLLEDPTILNKAAAVCYIMSTDVQQYPSAPNSCSNPFGQSLSNFSESYNEMNTSLVSWATTYPGLDNIPCDLTATGYTTEEKNQILQAFKDYLGNTSSTGVGDDPNDNPELDHVNALNGVISNLGKPELIPMISFFLDNPQHIPFIEEFVNKVDQFISENSLNQLHAYYYKNLNFDCIYSGDFSSCAKVSLIENLGVILAESDIDYLKSNFTIYNEIEIFVVSKIHENESKQNLSKSVASAYVKLLKDENLTDLSIDLGDVGNFDDPYWEIAKDLILESVKELLVDLIPGGVLATIGPEVIQNIQSGNWMEVMYGTADIILNEGEAFFPAWKIANFAAGAFLTGQQLKKVFKAFNKAKSMGGEFLQKIYNVFQHKLGWSIKQIRERFKWIDNSIGAKLDNVSSSVFFNKLKDEFGFEIHVFTDFNGNPVFKILDIGTSHSIYMLTYPDSASGFAATIEFILSSQNANSWSDIKNDNKYKIRFNE